jgi:hypothetical protein
VRVRVFNESVPSDRELSLNWRDSGSGKTQVLPVDLLEGESRIFVVPDNGLESITLVGDDVTFDNVGWRAPRAARDLSVIYFGDDDPTDPTASRFYLQRALGESVDARIGLVGAADTDVGEAFDDPRFLPIWFATSFRTDAEAAQARELLDRGWIGVFAMESVEAGAWLNTFVDGPSQGVREGQVDDYALLGQIDFQHPVFASFTDPRFSDFTRIHFWKRRVIPSAWEQAGSVLARFDDDMPALSEFAVGRGRLLTLATSWRPEDSQLALSSKFVPLVYSILDVAGLSSRRALTAVRIGEPIPLDGDATIERLEAGGDRVTVGEFSDAFAPDRPGLYAFAPRTGEEALVAANLDARESRVTPMDLGVIRDLGVPVIEAVGPTDAGLAALRTENRSGFEKESRQRFWRWLLAAAACIVILETLTAGRLARRRTAEA